MADFTDLILKHEGKTFCIMGGAGEDVLARHLAEVSADIYISANGHGLAQRDPDYFLAMDQLNGHDRCRPMGDSLRSRHAAPILSAHPYADYQLLIWPRQPRLVLSGMVATWAAWMMGAKAVFLTGMDGYGGRPAYVDEAVKMARDVHCPVRVVGGGPLTQAWPAFDPGERFEDYTPSPAIQSWLGTGEKVTIRVRKPTQIRGLYRAIGDELTVTRYEVRRQLRHRMVHEV